MPALVIFAFIWVLLYSFTRGKGKPTTKRLKFKPPSGRDLRKIRVAESRIAINSVPKNQDNSIVDVTGKTYQIEADQLGFNLVKYPHEVPYWSHKYIYSFSDINNASNAQLQFYNIFKKSFLEGIFLDIENNTNYPFILLFDLLIGYESHGDINLLEKQLYALGQCYPKTKVYGRSFLGDRMERIGNQDGINRLQAEHNSSIQQYYQNDYEDWRLGTRYKTKLKLNQEEIEILNNFYYSSNSFSGIEFCNLEIIKLFLSTLRELKELKVLPKHFEKIGDIIARKHFKYRVNSYNYKYIIESTPRDIYLLIFKFCENAVRERYGHKRKVSTDLYYTHIEIINALNEIKSDFIHVIASLISTIAEPDEVTEIELNSKNTNRWKLKFELLLDDLSDGKKFIGEVKSLAYLNKGNPSVENIYFQGSKDIAPIDKEAALTLYVHYLFEDLNSSTFDNKTFTKTIQKSLFNTNEQLRDFEEIVSELIREHNLARALEKVSKIYIPKRKKIALDRNLINEVHHRHSGTVELLNEYLNDEFEDEENIIATRELNAEELQIQISPKKEEEKFSTLDNGIFLDNNQWDLLNLFVKSSLTIPQTDINAFMKSKGLFKNQFIESINEACYEILDDVLIEEEGDNYIIHETHYQRILNK